MRRVKHMNKVQLLSSCMILGNHIYIFIHFYEIGKVLRYYNFRQKGKAQVQMFYRKK